IYGGSVPQGALVTNWLSSRPMVLIGDISYSWYLWHWPVLIIGGLLYPEGDIGYRVTLALLSLILATCAYLAVEQPLRSSRRLVIKPRLTVGMSVLLMLMASAGV